MFLFILAALVAAAGAVLVPGTLGPLSVAMRASYITDHHRWDPYAPRDGPHRRRIPVSVFMPLEPGRHRESVVEAVPYMPPETAAVYGRDAAKMGPFNESLFQGWTIEYTRLPSPPPPAQDLILYGDEKPRYPVVIFSPGLGGTRLLYGSWARALSSQGYIVISVDHPYETSITEFPDGTVVRGRNITTLPDIIRAVNIRAADVTSLVDRLHDPNELDQLLAGFPGEADLEKIAMFGHSLGGATSVAALQRDKRILGGVNWDGHIFGNVSSVYDFEQPLALVGIPGHGAVPNSNWPELYARARGPKIELAVNQTTHLSFMDISLLAGALRLSDEERAAVEGLLGKIDGKRLQRQIVSIMTAFLELVFWGKREALQGVGDVLCDVSVVRSQL